MYYTKDKIRESLKSMAEPDYAVFSGGLLGKETPLYGVRLPKLRQFAKEVAKTDGMEYLEKTTFHRENTCKKADREASSETVYGTIYMEEIMLYGMTLGYIRGKPEILFPYIRKYVSWIDNWSLCDSFCCGLKQTKKHLPEMWEFLQPYLKSDREFEIRFGVVMLMDYYVNPAYIDRILKIADNIRHGGYYVKTGVAWLLSVCLVKEWEKSFAYMSSPDNQLDADTYAKTVQKCRESYRLTQEQKDSLTKLKTAFLAGKRCR